MEAETLRNWWEELFQVREFAFYHDFAADLTRREVDFVIAALNLDGVETVLDLACGGGRHSIELAQRGFSVIGVDAAPPVIAAARARATELDLNAVFVVGDMRQLDEENRFDAILVMNSSLGFFDDATNRAVLQRIARALAPGGKLLLQCINPYRIESYLREFRSGWYQIGKGYVLREARFEPMEAALMINYRYIDPGEGLELTHPGDRIRLYGFPELKALIADAGLLLRSAFGDAVLPPEPFIETSQWQVLVAEKPRPLNIDLADDDAESDEPAD